jgi:hypothetical protein
MHPMPGTWRRVIYLVIGGAAQPFKNVFGVIGGFCKVRCQQCIEG